MQSSDKLRLFNFLLGNEPIHEFEPWIYSRPDLETSFGEALYFELLAINYKDSAVVENLKAIVLGNFISHADFEDFKYKTTLLNAGWSPNRNFAVDLTNLPNTPALQRAADILKEFGGLVFVAPESGGDANRILLEFLKKPEAGRDMSEYGVEKELACFAYAQNGYINLFVDAENTFYQLDNVVSEKLYQYKGQGFDQLVRQLLENNTEANFEVIGRRKIEARPATGMSDQKKSWIDRFFGK